MASIRKITNPTSGSTRWVVYYRSPDGASKQKRFPRKVDAERWLTGTEHSMLTGSFADPRLGRRTFGDWWDAWRATRVDLRPSTQVRDDTYYRCHIEPRFAEWPLGRISRTELREWVAELSAKGLAPATVHKAAQLVSKALAAAVDERLIATNPAERLPLPKVIAEPMRFCTPGEVVDLADAIDSRFRTWVYVAAYSGLRLGELVALRRASVDLMRGRVEVVATASEVRGSIFEGPPKTRAGQRVVPLPGPVCDLLADQCVGLDAGALVFPSPGGGHLRAGAFRRRFFLPAAVKAGLGEQVKGDDGRRRYEGLPIHDLRHTAVTFWIAAGASAKEVATWAGHSSVATVLDRYGHLLPGQEDRVTEALGTMFEGATATPPAEVIALPRSTSC